MAKKKKGKRGRPKKVKQAVNQEYSVIGERDLMALARLSDTMKARASSASGEYGQAVKDAQEKKNLDPAAFRIADRLRRTGDRDPVRLRALWDNLMYYCDVFKVAGKRASDMFKDAKPKKEKPEKSTAEAAQEAIEADSKVVPIKPDGEAEAKVA